MNEPREDHLTFVYRNWRGEVATRTVTPINIWFGYTEWHPDRQWFMRAVDVETGKERDFAVKDIISIADPWQPIETAPRDGTSVFLWQPVQHGRGNIVIGCWSDDIYAKYPVPYWIVGEEHKKKKYWRGNDPTHWMPIPKPPAAGGADA